MTDEATAFAREAQHGAPRRRPALPETLAWAVATAWSEQLAPLWLVSDSADSDPLTLVRSYDWVHLQLVGTNSAASARATLTAWLWLTSCDGYSGDENPRFWKRVLSELQRHGGDDGPPPMSDAVRFFTCPGGEFPRVRVETYDLSIVKVFTGRVPTQMDAVHSAQLRRMFQRLQPYLVSERLQRTIPVSVQSEDLELVLKREDENGQRVSAGGRDSLLRLRELSENGGETAFLDALKAELTAAPQPSQPLELPLFDVRSVYIPMWSLKPTPQPRDPSLQCKALSMERVTLNEGWSDAQFYESGSQAASQLRWLLGLNTPAKPSRLLRVSIDRQSLSPSLLAAVCSALPHSRAVSTVQLSLPEPPSSPPFRTLTNVDWAWLGYSIFHPDADQSMCSDLELVLTAAEASHDAIRVFQLMEQGNNLANVENPTQLPPSTFYHVARLKDETEIRRYPSLTAPVVLRHSIPTERFCVDNATSLDDWVRVVTPGFGFGWVPSAAVLDVESRPPGKSRLQGLRLRSAHTTETIPRALDVVLAVGERLTRLDAVACGELSRQNLLLVLLSCPVLKTLSVSHDGSLWASGELLPREPFLPLLEELSLVLPDSTLRLGGRRLASLRRLRALRVNALPEGDNFPRNRVAVLSFLQAHPSVEYFHWCDGDATGRGSRANTNRNQYTARRQRSHLLVGELPHPASSSGLCLSCRFAVVGAVHATRTATPSAAFSRLDEDVLSLIFSFSPRCGLRDLWIGP